ncbi:glycoside hydrolase superfamily [Mycena haematopus]|nr:glycoside hydrolase superfamily [Mycena haematopus]
MKLTRLLVALAAASFPNVLASVEKRQSFEDNSAEYVMPVGSPGFYNGHSKAAVTLDQHSLLLDGKRVMVFSGEFHPFRLPSPELWYDVLQKFKASGFNGVSVYWHWGLSAPNPNEVRFTQHNDLAKFFQVAKDVGILVIVRPGPYINAETAAGGIPGWATNVPGLARTNNTAYRAAWFPYVHGFAEATAPFQYPDGPVIAVQSENEYATTAQARIPGLNEHMQDIINVLRAGGITKVPTIHNDKNPAGQYAMPGLGKVDLYGWDGYPLGFDCNNPSVWTELSTQSDTSHQTWNPAEPLALFEWQGGAFSYWSGPGYDQCYKLVNEQFANVYYKNNYASGAGIQNLYMTYGGTNWGNMHCTTIYSSYDYGAAISEDRTPTPKLAEIKLQGYFLHASPDYLLVGRVGNGTVGLGTAYSTSPDIYTNKSRVTHLQGQLLLRRDYDPKAGNLTLAGRESKIIVTNYPFGASKLEYATAEVLTWATFDKIDTIILAKISHSGQPPSVRRRQQTITVSGSPSGLTVGDLANSRVIVGDKKTVSGIFAPRLSVSGTGHSHYDLGPDTPSVLLTGDINATTTLHVFAPNNLPPSLEWCRDPHERVTWSLRGEVQFPAVIAAAKIPCLRTSSGSARTRAGAGSAFDDSTWVLANKTTTQRPQQPTAGKFVLYSSEYGFHAGQFVWRGHFTAMRLAYSFDPGRILFGYSVFINSHFLGSGQAAP